MALAASLRAFATMFLGPTTRPVGQLVTYPAPSGMTLSSEYAVGVRPIDGAWQALDAYRTTVDLDTSSSAAMVGFDASGPVEVKITKKTGTMRSARVRPLAYAITPSLSADGKTATFELPRPLNVSFEADGDRLHNVQVFANPIERDIPSPGHRVIFFGPGVHILPGDHLLRVPSDTTVYIAGGAVVRGALVIANVHNVLVRGRGIVDPSGYFKPGATSTVRIDRSRNVGVRDITILQSQSGGFNIIDSDDVAIANAREINADRWSDGVDVVSSSNVLVDHVFLRTSDDSIAVFASTPWGGRGGTRNVAVRNSILWADVAHPILVGTHANPPAPRSFSVSTSRTSTFSSTTSTAEAGSSRARWP